MKKLFLLLIMVFALTVAKAQTATTDYIYSYDGFEVKTGIINLDGTEYVSTGLYSKDGKSLVYAISAIPRDSYYTKFFIIDGCETICSGAFQGESDWNIYMPSSVKNIAPDAFVSKLKTGGTNFLKGIQNNCKEQNSSSIISNIESKPGTGEIARYNIQGVMLSEPTRGVNIVQKSDGSSEKIVVNQ